MGWFSKNKENTSAKKSSQVNWIDLTEVEQLETIKEESKHIPVLIYKHSTRCSISIMAKNELDKHWEIPAEEMKCYYLDLLNHRTVSNQISEMFGVVHQSPQVLIIKNGICVYHASHASINARTIKNTLKTL